MVTGITHFGAFISLPGGKTGLVHISEVADAYVRDIKDFLKENDPVKVKIISYDGANKIGLSVRQAQPKPAGAPPFARSGPGGGMGGGGGGGRPMGGRGGRGAPRGTFEDKLARFMKEADEKQSDLRRHNEKKGKGGGPRGRGEGTAG